MQRCPNCQAQQIDGTIFCSECGGSFVAAARQQSTTPISRARAPEIARAVASDTAAPHETRLTLTVIGSGQQMRLALQDELLIGRKDMARGIDPDIDLGAHGGYDAGVSRRHAIISWRNGGYMVEDLGSANGTFINEQPVDAAQPGALHNGDELRCGMLALRVDISP